VISKGGIGLVFFSTSRLYNSSPGDQKMLPTRRSEKQKPYQTIPAKNIHISFGSSHVRLYYHPAPKTLL